MAKKTPKRTRRVSEEDVLESAYRNVSGYKGKIRKSRSHNLTPVVIAFCIALIAVIVCVIAGCMYYFNSELNGFILENVSVAGVDIGGMTQADAISAVRSATENTYTRTPMTVKVLDSEIQIPVEYVGKLDVRSAVRDAYKFGKTGSASKQQQEQQIAMTTGYNVDLTAYLDLNDNAIRQILAELGKNYSSTLSQSTYEIIGSAPSQSLVIKLGVPEYGLDLNQLYQDVLDAYSNNKFEVIGQCGMIEPDPIDLDLIYTQNYVAPVDAYYEKSTRSIIPEIDGYGFDLENAKSRLDNANYGSIIEIPFLSLEAEVTSESISSLLFRDTLATYTGTSTSDPDRNTNLRLACEAIDGLVLYPGDKFSYNDALGERTKARGYRPGPSYAGNKTVMTIGGGICQVSSALYYCVLKAEMEVTLRYRHGFMPSYMPVGLDATVSWGTKDFCFKNTLDYPVRIEASASDGDTTVTLIGTELRDYRPELESDILSETKHETNYKIMNSDNPDGYKDGDYITEPYNGYEVKTYLCKYALNSGTQLSKELIDHSVYRKRDAIICKIQDTKSDPTNPESNHNDTPSEGGTLPS